VEVSVGKVGKPTNDFHNAAQLVDEVSTDFAVIQAEFYGAMLRDCRTSKVSHPAKYWVIKDDYERFLAAD